MGGSRRGGGWNRERGVGFKFQVRVENNRNLDFHVARNLGKHFRDREGKEGKELA